MPFCASRLSLCRAPCYAESIYGCICCIFGLQSLVRQAVTGGPRGIYRKLICSCIIYALPLLLATDNPSCRHRHDVQPGLYLQLSNLGCCRLAQVYLRFAVRPAAQREVHIQSRYLCFCFAARGQLPLSSTLSCRPVGISGAVL